MRHTWTTKGWTCKKCKSANGHVEAFCCSTVAYFICQDCGNRQKTTAKKAMALCDKVLFSELGFVGHLDRRERMKEILKAMYPEANIDLKVMGYKTPRADKQATDGK
jgi:hypothetical protein